MADTLKEKEKKTEVLKHFEEKAKEVTEGKKPKINLSKTVRVEFTKDVGFIKKGHVQKISQLARELYEKQKCIKVIND